MVGVVDVNIVESSQECARDGASGSDEDVLARVLVDGACRADGGGGSERHAAEHRREEGAGRRPAERGGGPPGEVAGVLLRRPSQGPSQGPYFYTPKVEGGE